MRTEVLTPPKDVKQRKALALQATKHVAKYALIALLLLATAVVLYVAS